jgi:hypothetical protein
MRYLLLFVLSLIFYSCWIKPTPDPGYTKVWGNKPIYGSDPTVKKITYINAALPVVTAGNIYVKGNYIFQAETGRGIHVIDNTVPALAKRIGFITVNGCSQISMKGNYIYTNSYDDLIVIDMTDMNNVKEVKRLPGAFPEGRSNYYYLQPIEPGYYECPRYDSLVIGWRKDSVIKACYKN